MFPSKNLRYQFKSTLSLGLPLIAMTLTQSVIHLIDTIMVGWYGVTELAAAVLGTTFFFVFFIMGSGFAAAVMPLVSEAVAGGKEVVIRRVTRMGMWLSVLYAICSIPIIFFSGKILELLGQDPELSNMAQTYLRYVCVSMAPALIIMVLRSYLSALERTTVFLWIIISSLLLNTTLNWVLIFGNLGMPELGLVGAALASTITQIITTLILIIYIIKDKELSKYAIFKRIYKIDWNVFGIVFNLGWPIGLTWLAEVLSFAGTAIIIGLMGTIPLAAHGIALQIVSISFMFHLGLSQACTVKISYYLEKKDIDSLGKGIIAAFVLSLMLVILAVLIFLFLPEQILGAFLAPDDPSRGLIIALGTTLLMMAAIFQVFDSGQVMILGSLRGFKDTKVPMLMAAFGYWAVGLPSSYYLGIYLEFGAPGVWVGLAVGLALVCCLLGLRFKFIYKMLNF
jgi:MATE family multidrug resistance protein